MLRNGVERANNTCADITPYPSSLDLNDGDVVLTDFSPAVGHFTCFLIDASPVDAVLFIALFSCSPMCFRLFIPYFCSGLQIMHAWEHIGHCPVLLTQVRVWGAVGLYVFLCVLLE
ncbi:hypothetical protein BDR04DRAFT_223453 [Suillus decipiens]|nr:hypothetical protein BDR04DRAFT_223453 [Suillus decipiens]